MLILYVIYRGYDMSQNFILFIILLYFIYSYYYYYSIKTVIDPNY